MAHGFSDKAMREQEGVIKRYVDLLILRLRGQCEENGGSAAVDIKEYYNWTTFDAIGDLVFGESFGCLEANRQHPWIEAIFNAVRQGAALTGLAYLGYAGLVQILLKAAMLTHVQELNAYIEAKLNVRLAEKPGKEDLFEGLLKKRETLGLSFAHLAGNASLLVVAGSETTATLLSGATYLLTTNPEALAKVVHEVRLSFNSADEIDIASVGRLPYMLAVLNEALRCYPPVLANLVRKVPIGGQTISGHFVPEGVSSISYRTIDSLANAGHQTLVEVQQWSANHDASNWTDPWIFRPERFLDTAEEAASKGNHLEALQSFNVGPRNCIGRK